MHMGKKKRGGGGGGRYRGRQGGGGYGRGNGGGRPGRGRRRSGGGPDMGPRHEYDGGPDNGELLPLVTGSGVLEMHPNGYGFLRDPATNFTRERTDPFVPGTMIEKFGLREGVLITGMVQRHRRGQGPRLKEILDVDGIAPEDYTKVKGFDDLTPINPEEWLQLETGQTPITTRVMDLLTPLGKGQRALIVAPPRTGKTILIQHISNAVTTNYPEVVMIVLLVDERPEEVTDMQRIVKGEVFASSLDRDVESHVRLS
jgi:transcription termination factor Rho